MIWHDLLLEGWFEETILRRALGEAFCLPPHDVLLLQSVSVLPEEYVLAVVVRQLPGEFRTGLSVFVAPHLVGLGVQGIARSLCSNLITRALISDESPDPYTMLLLDAQGVLEPVSLDVISLDERGEYRLCRS